MKHFLVDFDSTLAETIKGLLTHVNDTFGTEYTTEQITDWDTENVIDSKHSGYMWGTLFTDPNVTLNLEPLEGAIETVNSLISTGHSCVIVSDRSPQLAEATRTWLDRYLPHSLPLYLTRSPLRKKGIKDTRLTKSQVAYLYRLNWVIEDAPHQSELLASRDYIDGVYLIDKPYNQGVEHPKINRINSWAELADHEGVAVAQEV